MPCLMCSSGGHAGGGGGGIMDNHGSPSNGMDLCQGRGYGGGGGAFVDSLPGVILIEVSP